MTEEKALLARIAEALERLVPPAPPRAADPLAHPAYVWRDARLAAVEEFRAQPLGLLHGIDIQKARLLENTRRLARGLPAHDVLLWGARGMGKSSLVSSVVAHVREDRENLALVQVPGAALATLPQLFALLRGQPRAYVVFGDDLSFEANQQAARDLRSLLEGGAEARPANCRIYITSNRRHLVPRDLAEQDSAINPRDVVDDRLALADRFGLSLGFHACSQDEYLAILHGYAEAHGLQVDEHAAIAWTVERGARSGRVAWQYFQEMLGAAGRRA